MEFATAFPPRIAEASKSGRMEERHQEDKLGYTLFCCYDILLMARLRRSISRIQLRVSHLLLKMVAVCHEFKKWRSLANDACKNHSDGPYSATNQPLSTFRNQQRSQIFLSATIGTKQSGKLRPELRQYSQVGEDLADMRSQMKCSL